MSSSQWLVCYFGFIVPFIIVEAPENLKRALATFVVLLFAGLGWAVTCVALFTSDWYKGVEKAVGFTLGF